MPGRVGPVVPRLNVGADGGPSRGAAEQLQTDAFSQRDDKSHRPTKTPASATAAQIRSGGDIFYVLCLKGSSMEPQQQATCESAIQLGDLTINAKGGK